MKSTPFQRIANVVCRRLETPTNREFLASPIRRARGSNGRKVVVKNDGRLRGFSEKPLSETDRDEVAGAIAVALCADLTDSRTLAHALGLSFRGETPQAVALNPGELLQHGDKLVEMIESGEIRLSFAQWKQIFTAARCTLGRKRKAARENLQSSLEELTGTDLQIDLTAPKAIEQWQENERLAEERMVKARRATIAKHAWLLHSCLHAALRADASRRRRSNFRVALRHLRKAVAVTMGREGHESQLSRTAAYERDNTFRAYVAEGEAQLAREADTRECKARELQAVRDLYAVAD